MTKTIPCLAWLVAAGCADPQYPGSKDAASPPKQQTGPEGGLFTGEARKDAGAPPDAPPRDASVRDADLTEDSGTDAMAPANAPPGCGPVGTQILEIESYVEWDPASVSLLGIPVETVQGGNGRVRILAISTAVATEDGWKGSIKACWGEVPDFMAFGRKFGVFIPDQSFDHITRTWDTYMHAACMQPKCVITSDRVTVQLGLDLPADQAWPARDAGLEPGMVLDEDADDKPGVTAYVRGPNEPGGYTYVSLPSLEQVDRLFLAIRLSSDLLGEITTCDNTDGQGRRPGLSLRAVGCRVMGGARDCTPAEVQLANENLPDWRVPKFEWRARRAPDGITCEQVRMLSGVGGDTSGVMSP